MGASSVDYLGRSGKPIFHALARYAHPLMTAAPREGVLVAARSLGGMQKEALVVSAGSALGWRLASDEGAYLAGLDAAPCPLSFFTVGWVAQIHAALEQVARDAAEPLPEARLVLDSYYTMRGSALQGTMTGGARDAHLTVQFAGEDAPQRLLHAVQSAVIAAPITSLLRQPLANRFALRHNDRELPVDGLGALQGALPAVPDADYDAARVAPGAAEQLIRRGGLTPAATHTVTRAGGSLAAEQDRVLHVRGISRRRPDGLIEVEQHLYNPHGSIFTFLCDVSGDFAAARAPDPLSYAAAGIAFCFMTQFGRFASITRLPLEDCRLVQRLDFPRGVAEPVETTVEVRTGADDEAARHLLRMSEQTCFLHALCKAPLKIRVGALPWSAEPPLAVASVTHP